MTADGWSLDDKRQPLLSEDKLGVAPTAPMTEAEHNKNNLPDVLARWTQREAAELDRPRTAQSFSVPKADIAADGAYELSINRYKETVHEAVEHESPAVIIAELKRLEAEIAAGLATLEEMVG
jgi:type I restriction enzyme M protein